MGEKFLTPCMFSTEDRQQVLDSLHQEEECHSLLAQVARLREGMLKPWTLEVPHDKVRRVPSICQRKTKAQIAPQESSVKAIHEMICSWCIPVCENNRRLKNPHTDYQLQNVRTGVRCGPHLIKRNMCLFSGANIQQLVPMKLKLKLAIDKKC